MVENALRHKPAKVGMERAGKFRLLTPQPSLIVLSIVFFNRKSYRVDELTPKK